MSLQLLAKQMEAKGRGGDSVLVHMTPGEVDGLQKLAESAGGSLSVNPETGLVEANFLKRMLPTLVGIGVGAFAGPVAGAAAGAAVGGYQAKRNDQDVGMGMLMGGLGGYGGGTMGAGLTAAGAGAGAAGATAAPLTASQSLSQAGQGLTAIGTDAAKRAAFAKSVGMSGLGMAAAPMMAPGKAPGEIPTDDERYVYDFDYGRTGAERTPVASSAERTYFQPTYRRVFSAAEGGEVADAAPVDSGIAGGMSGASKAAFDYLMGNTASSAPAGGIANLAARATPGVGSDNMYAFDPVTGTFLRNPNIPGASTSGSPVGTSFAGSGGSEPAPPNPDFDTPEKQAAFYADPKNAVFGDITRGVQTALSYTPMSLFARAVAPEYMAQRAAEQDRITRGDYSSGFAIGSDGSPASGYGVDSWSGNMSDYAGSSMDQGDRGEAAGGLITLADGGLMGLAKGGMKSGGFVVPADVVSMVGEGNTDAGYSRIKSMIPGATAIKGKDGGQADTVKTSIEGKQPARVAHGEMYVPPETVKRMGGAKKLYAMMDRVREQATGSKKQIKPVSLKRAMA
jgi:hypothetical protein